MMRKYFLLLITLLTFTAACAGEDTPVGYWNTIDDVSHAVQSQVQIIENSDHSLSGKIVRIFPHAGQSVNDICVHCQGALHNQRILGMTVLTGLKKDGNEWSGGNILDPTSGKVYRCVIRVMDNGKKLNVHGYIGIRLIGRSQVWVRV